MKFRESGYGSLRIICKTETRTKRLYEKPETGVHGICFFYSKSTTFAGGIISTFAHPAKGPGFDEVIIPHADTTNYRSEMDRNMFYGCRAMHRLNVTYSEKLCCFITK